jgi:hypothetical protein
MKQFTELEEGQLFLWQDRVYRKLRDVYVDDKLENGLVQSMFVKTPEGFVLSMATSTENFNPYCEVQPCRMTFISS